MLEAACYSLRRSLLILAMFSVRGVSAADWGSRFTEIMLSVKQKQTIIDKFKTHKSDTGSPQVQIAILTAEIKELTSHLRMHKKDYSSRRGLIKKINERRRLLKYLEREDKKAWDTIKENLGLK